MSLHPMADKQLRRETLLESATQLQQKLGAIGTLNLHCLLLEMFDATDATERTAMAMEKIAVALVRIANPLMRMRPDGEIEVLAGSWPAGKPKP